MCITQHNALWELREIILIFCEKAIRYTMIPIIIIRSGGQLRTIPLFSSYHLYLTKPLQGHLHGYQRRQQSGLYKLYEVSPQTCSHVLVARGILHQQAQTCFYGSAQFNHLSLTSVDIVGIFPYSSFLVGCCSHDLFNVALNVRVYVPSSVFSSILVTQLTHTEEQILPQLYRSATSSHQ